MNSLYASHLKRIVDLVSATVLLALLSPVLVVVGLAVWLIDGWPIFFFQMRPGRKQVLFRMVKFRTMRVPTDSGGEPQPDQQRVTSLGALLRRTSLDELPELLNVVSGSMSLVGPRPLLVRYLPYFRETERVRFQVRPGITGLAVVNGRNMLSWDDRLALDVRYVEQLSPAVDLRIMLSTVGAVFSGRDVVVAADTVMQNLDDERRHEVAQRHG
jgi:undecaprenyl phosphate N,N'-diacetylbacillosamine 1-phosphate transferase